MYATKLKKIYGIGEGLFDLPLTYGDASCGGGIRFARILAVGRLVVVIQPNYCPSEDLSEGLTVDFSVKLMSWQSLIPCDVYDISTFEYNVPTFESPPAPVGACKHMSFVVPGAQFSSLAVDLGPL